MDSNNSVCPVCTLYLRPGITLEAHLKSHPKQKVIEALVRLSHTDQVPKVETSQSVVQPQPSGSSQSWPAANMGLNAISGNFSGVPGNHSIIYQQIMSSTSQQPGVLNVNPMNQQYVTIPAVFNPQMMCPYVYQQQQVIIHRPLPIELPDSKGVSQLSPTPSNFSDSPPQAAITEEVIETEKTEDENVDLATVIESDIDEPEFIAISGEFDEKEVIISEEVTEKAIVDESTEQDSENKEMCVESEVIIISEEVQCSEPMKEDLNKACQTLNQMPNETLQEEQDVELVYEHAESEVIEDKTDYFDASAVNLVPMVDGFEQNVKAGFSNHGQGGPQQSEVNFIEMDGMNLVLANDFMGSQVISQVEDYDFVQNKEKNRVLMTIGTIGGQDEVFTHEQGHLEADDIADHISEISNVHTTEEVGPHSPPSESNGASTDIASWNRYHEGSSGMSTSYDLIARETWEASDCSDNELPPLQSRLPQHVQYDDPADDDNPTVSGYISPPITFKCPQCDEHFNCLKDRREHQSEAHGSNSSSSYNEIGSQIGKKSVKKLVIKPRKPKKEAIDFTNKLKIESTEVRDLSENKDDLMLTATSSETITKFESMNSNGTFLCHMCDIILPTFKDLKEHKMEYHKLGVTGSGKHKCSTCNEIFLTEPLYTEHLKVHPLECKLCGKLFYRRQSMQLHMKRHLGIKPYKCALCDKSFLTKQKHDEHKNIHTGEAPIKCNLCDESFRRHSNLIQHRNRHHLNLKKKLKDFVCFCGEVFHSKKKLAWHKEIHDTKPKACTYCAEKFVHSSSLTRHIRRAHAEHYADSNKTNVECPVCKGIYLKSSLETHLKCHSGVRPFTCLICNKDFTTKWNLKLHKWTHASRTSKPYKCELCKGAFIREADYTAHMNSHKSVRPYTCNYCGAQFIRKYNCQRHVKEHEKGKTFTCNVCNKQFHRSYYLNDHMRVHSGVRPYSCHICGKTSTTKSNHNKHVRIHHAREPVSTEN